MTKYITKLIAINKRVTVYVAHTRGTWIVKHGVHSGCHTDLNQAAKVCYAKCTDVWQIVNIRTTGKCVARVYPISPNCFEMSFTDGTSLKIVGEVLK